MNPTLPAQDPREPVKRESLVELIARCEEVLLMNRSEFIPRANMEKELKRVRKEIERARWRLERGRRSIQLRDLWALVAAISGPLGASRAEGVLSEVLIKTGDLVRRIALPESYIPTARGPVRTPGKMVGDEPEDSVMMSFGGPEFPDAPPGILISPFLPEMRRRERAKSDEKVRKAEETDIEIVDDMKDEDRS